MKLIIAAVKSNQKCEKVHIIHLKDDDDRYEVIAEGTHSKLNMWINLN